MRTPTFTLQHIFGLELTGIGADQIQLIERHSKAMSEAMHTAYRKELSNIGIIVPLGNSASRVMTPEEVQTGAVGMGNFGRFKVENAEHLSEGKRIGLENTVKEAGLPLRQFVRGFLRDHLGFSKIVAHNLADLFMKRWADRAETAKRYSEEMEDRHTLAATFDRRNVEATDRNLGGVTERDKADMMNGPQPDLTFPKHPVFDTKSRLFSAGR